MFNSNQRDNFTTEDTEFFSQRQKGAFRPSSSLYSVVKIIGQMINKQFQ